MPKYAETVHALERTVTGCKSAEPIKWTTILQESFSAAKQLAGNPFGLAEPRPTDVLRTYSDYSADTKAVGGRLMIMRKQPDGSTKELVGGYFMRFCQNTSKIGSPVRVRQRESGLSLITSGTT